MMRTIENNEDVPDGKVMLEFNCAIVIQSLPENERQTGKELYDDIIKRSCDRIGLLSSFFDVGSRADMDRCFSVILDACGSKKFFPLIHFEVHGNRFGFQMKNGEIISWLEIGDFCRAINIAIRNQLIVSLATCHGAYFITGIDIQKVSPFWGLIGPKDIITQDDIVEDFSNLFEELLYSFDIQKALDRLTTTQSRTKYTYLPAQIIFEEFLEKKFINMPIDRNTKLRTLTAKSKPHFPNLNRRQRRLKLKSQISEINRGEIILQMKQDFLMGRMG